MQRTGIEYLTHTWNPLAMRCTPVSAGCQHCWHLAMAARLSGHTDIDARARAAYRGGAPWLRADELSAPLRLRKPARIGVQFMGDLFHEDVPEPLIARVLNVVRECGSGWPDVEGPFSQFLVLTKRPERMAELMPRLRFDPNGEGLVWFAESADSPGCKLASLLRNLWLGVTAENQAMADERIPLLLKCPAAVRFVSIEPILGPVDVRAVSRYCPTHDFPGGFCLGHCPDARHIDWVIVGGETGPGARPIELEWVYDIRDQCKAAGVPFFMKTLGTALENELGRPRGWLPDTLRIHELPKGADDAE